FAPVRNLGLIVVDEEHDGSYKQEETPRYNGRDVAIVRAQAAGACVVLGSATPSLESRYNAERGKYTLVELPGRIEERPMPAVELIDMRTELLETRKQSTFSRRLTKAIQARLDRDTVSGKREYESILHGFRERSFDILVGTQMIAKGHDIPNVTLVGVVSADVGLSMPDFRAAERTFQLLTQVAGRAGRGAIP